MSLDTRILLKVQKFTIVATCRKERNLRDIASLNIGSVNNKSWKFAGVRPTGFPTIRIQQFTEFINYFNVDEISPEISPIELLVLIENAINRNGIFDARSLRII